MGGVKAALFLNNQIKKTMQKNATNTPEPMVQFVGEATNGDKPVTELPKELPTQTKELSREEKLKMLLAEFPELAQSLTKPEEPKQAVPPPTNSIPPKAIQRDNRIFILANHKKKGTVIIDLTDDVVVKDPITGITKTRRMRLIRGAQSIWQDEQKDLPKEHVAKNQVTLTFDRGRCIIPIHETLKIEAALISNRNTDNQNRVGHKDIYFYEWNPAKLNAIEEEKQSKIIEAMQIASTASMEDVKPHALYLGVAVNDEMGIALSDGAIRTGYSKKAMNEPEKFLKSIHSPVVKMAHLVRRALSEGKIDMGRQPNQAFWTDGGFICSVPSEREQVEFLTEFAMVSGEANSRFAEQLRNFFS